MEAGLQIVLSGALTFGVPLALAVRELFVLRRPSTGGWGGDPLPPVPPEPMPGQGPGTLPACLIPNLPPLPQSTKVLERV